MVRRVEAKSTGIVDTSFMTAFNEMIGEAELMEIYRGGSRYTWTNKQLSPKQSVLERVFANNSWEDKYPLVRVQVSVRIGSDHNPLVMDTGRENIQVTKYFRFNPSWLAQEAFNNWVLDRWPVRHKLNCLGHLHVVFRNLGRAMKGWVANFESEMRRDKNKFCSWK